MTVVIRGQRAELCAFTRAVGKGSRAQVEGFIPLMMFCTSSGVISGKEQRGGGRDIGLGVGSWNRQGGRNREG